MRTLLLFVFLALGSASCKSTPAECGGCKLRYCDEPAGDCDCGCFEGQEVRGATCKDGCFVRPPDQGRTIDCSTVGCAPPPLCSTGCKDTCGCCSCADGTTSGGLRCAGGCYVPIDMM